MRFFFRSRKFKILLSVFLGLVILAGILFATGETLTPGSNIVATVTAPFKEAANWVTSGVSKFFKAFGEYDKLALENEELRKENEALVSELLKHQEAVTENEFLKEFLEIKEKNKDYIMEPATVTVRDTNDPYGGFTVNKGSLDGIAVGDPVITSAGLVGYVSEVGLSYAKVTTILSSNTNIAAIDRRTADVGVVGGSLKLAAEGKCRMYNIRNTAPVAVGDYVVTSGGGVYPEGLIIGKISAVTADDVTLSLTAEIIPSAEVYSSDNVMIITYFAGQGAQTPED